MIKMGSFRSYVDLEEYEMKIPHPVNGTFLQPRFIPGELVIAEATNVLKFTSLSKTKGLSGSLFVTNARVVFVSSDHVCSEDSFPLLSINTLWYYESNSKGTSKDSSNVKKTRRKVKLGPMKAAAAQQGSNLSSNFYSYANSALSSGGLQSSSSHNLHTNLIQTSGSTRIHEIFLVCSNFRTLRISFKFSPIDQGLRICNAIIHHAFPEQLERLFYFDFCKAYNAEWTSALGGGVGIGGGITGGLSTRSYLSIPTYMDKGDWLRELNVTRTSTGGYRISGINEGFQLCGSLPEWIVVPSDVNDSRVMNIAEKLKGCRPPHWTWGDSRGAAILVMGKLNNEADSSAENSFFEALRRVHPKGIAPTIYDLDLVITLKEIRQSFVALTDLCCPESFSQYQDHDSKFYSHLENTKWLNIVSRVLSKCRDVVDTLSNQGNAIIFQEQEGRDLSCLFSSLVQLILDSRFRTVTGFFTLIQKDWVAFGHPFHSTHMHTSPVFLLFLDCVFQLQNQNPLEFEFNERVLSSLWDSSFDCTTGTFLFDSPQQRKTHELCKDSTAWISIFSSVNLDANSNSPSSSASSPASRAGSGSRRDVFLGKTVIPRSLVNPFFQVKSLLTSPPLLLRQNSSQLNTSPINNTQLLNVSSAMCDIQFWDTLYLHRTLETIPMIVTSGEGLVNSDPLVPMESNNSSPARSSTGSPTPSPSSKFYFPLPPLVDSYQQRRRPGRDTITELLVVEDLLANLTATTRYHRNVSSSGASGNIAGGSGLSLYQGYSKSNSPSSSSAGLLQQRHHHHNMSPSLSSSSVATHRSRGIGTSISSSSSVTSSPVMMHSASKFSSSVNNPLSNISSSNAHSVRRNPFIHLT